MEKGDVLTFVAKKERTYKENIDCKKEFRKGKKCSGLIIYCYKMDIPSKYKNCRDQRLEIKPKIGGRKTTRR